MPFANCRSARLDNDSENRFLEQGPIHLTVARVTQTSASFFHSVRRGLIRSPHIPDEVRPASLADGYVAQREFAESFLARNGGSLTGYKAACTNTHAQELLSIGFPVFGRLFSKLCWRSGQVLAADSFPMLALEPEFAFVIAQDVPETGPSATSWNRDTIVPYVGDMMPAIEVVGHGFEDWGVYDAPSFAADNAVHLGWVHGPSNSEWREIELADCRVELWVDDVVRKVGSGRNVLGHPMNVVAWFANTLPGHGHRLRAGDRVITGVSTDIYPASPGECIRADFGILGSVELTFSE